MTWTETVIVVMLWVGVCLVLFYGHWAVICGVVLIVAAMLQLSHRAEQQAFLRGVNEARRMLLPRLPDPPQPPRYVPEQQKHQPTVYLADGRAFRVGRDC